MKPTLLVLALVGCGGKSDAPPPERPHRPVTRNTVDRTDPEARAAGLQALETYQEAARTFWHGVRDLERRDVLDHARSQALWTNLLAGLDATDRLLARAAQDEHFALVHCLACTDRDWNGNGQIDDADRRFLELESDVSGATLDAADPRRRPTFRFDHADLLWARGMLAFQRAGIELVLAYDWRALDAIDVVVKREGGMKIRLVDPIRVGRAKAQLIAALELAVATREEYLAETDDDREWVPNPDQRDYPIPLRVDTALYDQWSGIISDVRRLLTSEDGIPLRQAARLVDDDLSALMPDVFIDLGAMLGQPRDIVIDLRGLPREDRDWTPEHVKTLLRGIVGAGLRDRMRETPLIGRLERMRADLLRGGDTIDMKVRYLLWLN